MQKNLKIFLTIFFVTSIVLLCTSLVLYTLKENEEEKKIALQKTLDEVIKAKESLEGKSKNLEVASAELKATIKSHEDRISALARSQEEERAKSDDYLAKMKQGEMEIKTLKSRLEEEGLEKEELLKRLNAVNEERLNLKFHLETLLKTKEELEKKAKELAEKEDISLGTIVIKQPPK